MSTTVKGWALPGNRFVTRKIASDVRTPLRGRLINKGDAYYMFCMCKDGKLTTEIGKVNVADVSRCDLCGKPIFEEHVRFCSSSCAEEHYRRECIGIEEQII